MFSLNCALFWRNNSQCTVIFIREELGKEKSGFEPETRFLIFETLISRSKRGRI